MINRFRQLIGKPLLSERSRLTADQFATAFKLMVRVMEWELERETGRVRHDKQQECRDMIYRAWEASLPYQGRQFETFRKTKLNFPVSGVEAVQQVFLEKLERVEKQNEAELIKGGRIPHPETFVLRYLKALVVQTCFKRPFRMTTGLASFFYGYEFSECFDVYDCLMQGQELEFKKERGPANWNEYLRTHMAYVRDRFGSFLAAEDETRWREFKAVREQSATAASGVRESLELLKPWGSQDLLPARFSRDDKSIPFFSEIKRSQLERSHIGRARRRALLDPDIFSRIALALGCPAPVTSFIIPRLKKMNMPNIHPPKLGQLPSPDNELFKQFTQQTEEHLDHLSSLRPAKLFVRVDEEQRGPIHDLEDDSSLSIVITSRDRVIEIFALDDQLYSKEAISLGALLPHAHGVFDEAFTEQQEVSWKLANRSRLTFHLRPTPGTETTSALELTIAYDEGFSLRRFFEGRTGTTVNHPQGFRARELLVGGGALVLVLMLSFFVVSHWFRSKQLPGVASENQGHVAIVETLPRDANLPQDKNTVRTGPTNGARPVYKRGPKPPTRNTGPSDSATKRRSGESGKPAVSYSQVRSVYLDPSSNDFPLQLHDELSKQMGENGFVIESSRDRADARLRVIALTPSNWAFRLVNDSGRGIPVSTVGADVDKQEEVKRAARQVVEALLQLTSQPSPQ